MAEPYHAQTSEDALEALHSSAQGLTATEVEHRLTEFGKNELAKAKKESLFIVFLRQFNNFLIYILIIAVIVSASVGEYIDAIVILIILLLNGIFGFIQEYKAGRAIEALKKLASLKASVLREGKQIEIDATDVVPGDIIILESGAKVPADARLITCYSCHTLESPLTGESTPVRKQIDAISIEKGLADRSNMVYAGTIMSQGRGNAVVVSTGMRTELGKIAGLIQETPNEPSPLQRYLETFGKKLGFGIIGLCVIIFLAGVYHGIAPIVMLISAISLAVAAVPEGLPAVVTITLALGVQRMVKRNVLVRQLPAVETLGSCNVICSDKTGTLTHDQMTVKEIFVDGKSIHVHGAGYGTEGHLDGTSKNVPLLLRIGALCNSALLETNGEPKVIGDPTEGALLVSAIKGGLTLADERKTYTKIDEIPFSSERRCMSTIHTQGKKTYVFTKGAPDRVLGLCTTVLVDGSVKKLTPALQKKILSQTEDYAKNALRVLGFAYTDKPVKGYEKNLIFVGLQAMIDPPRKEAIEAISACNAAGIKVVMITGDHKLTATAIAERMGIIGRAIDGSELSRIKDLSKEAEDIGVYARVEPSQKVRIVEAFKAKGYVVAMTGDGVNDAPALKKADIGVAMGRTGTDVAREASDMILLDDNFASLVAAVSEGRTIFTNIQKFIEYLLTCNLAEVGVIFFAIMLGMPLPLIAIQILWMNLITDGLPALALGLDPAEPDVMAQPPKKKGTILNRRGEQRMGIDALLIIIATLGVFLSLQPDPTEQLARSMAFSTIVILQLIQALSCRSLHHSILQVGIFKNKWLWGALFLSLTLHLAVFYTPLSVYFDVVPLTLAHWSVIASVGLAYLILREGIKVACYQKE